MLSEPVAVVLARLVISGGGHHRLHEEITESAGYLRQQGYRREDRMSVIQDWLKLSKDAQISTARFDALKEIFENNEDNVFNLLTRVQKTGLEIYKALWNGALKKSRAT